MNLLQNSSPQLNLKIKTHIDLTPLIDILFTLLVFFFISYSQNQKSKPINSTPISLPQSQSSQNNKPSLSLVISVPDNDSFYLQNQKIPKHKLQSKLQNLISKSPKSSIAVKADQKVNIQTLFSLLDIIQASGYQKTPLLYSQKSKSSN